MSANANDRFGGRERGFQDGVRGKERERKIAAGSDSGKFCKDKMGIRVGRETRLNRFEVDEFTPSTGALRRWGEEEGRGKTSGDQSFAKGSVGAPNHVGWVGEWKI